MLFSQRKRLKPIKEIIQTDSMDRDLRVGLWNSLQTSYWNEVIGDWLSVPSNQNQRTLFQNLWIDFFKEPLDEVTEHFPTLLEKIKNYYFSCKWYEVYDFIEFVASNYPDEETIASFKALCNFVLEKELSGYRFVGDYITELTSEEELSTIEEALNILDKFKGAKIHLRTAIERLSDKKFPDYRNSIKESISAVGSVIEVLSGEKHHFKKGIIEIEKRRNMSLHPALKEAFIKLYGYTSDANGIRHELLEEPNLDFDDAKFMLVSCSAFVNYLISNFYTE